jgi:UDP-N-acetyl-D-galactosamine dehydrogenase
MDTNWNIYQQLIDKKARLAVIGLGYVGLPIALEFGKKIKVIGFDIRQDRIELMRKGIDPSEELKSEDFEGVDIEFTSNPNDLMKASFFIVAVPTPIDGSNMPDLGPLLSASKSVGKALKLGDYVVFESTTYPGCTEEDCVPILEKMSGLRFNIDFKVGYSPERINPGDKTHTIRNILKIVSGSDSIALEQVASVYQLVVDAGLHKAPSIKVAEAAKIIENTQRDLNIALMNELSIIFNKLEINTFDVIEAAGTKWNFLKFTPGLVGGHCIGVDPYYLVYKAKKMRYYAQVITSGRYVNDTMGFYVGKQTVKKLIAFGKNILETRVLVMGATFKENVTDIRNSKVPDIIRELESFGAKVDLVDPGANTEHFSREYDILLKSGIFTPEMEITPYAQNKYDAVIVTLGHNQYLNLDEEFFKNLLNDNGLLVDVKGIYRNKIKDIQYWSL